MRTESETEKEGKKLSSICWFSPQIINWLQAGRQKPENPSWSPTWMMELNSPFCIVFPGALAGSSTVSRAASTGAGACVACCGLI